MKLGDKVVCPTVGKNAVVIWIGSSPFGGRTVELEVDEPTPYIGRPNPRRRILAHESHIHQ